MLKDNKHSYKLVFNKPSKKVVEYCYNYKNIKNIVIGISENGFVISVNTRGKHTCDRILTSEDPLFSDAIKKALLLYLIRYNKGFVFKIATIYIDDVPDVEIFGDVDHPPIYSMINENLFRKMPESFLSDAVAKHILNTTKSKYDRRTVALYDFILSKSKIYETERFVYLWSTFNAMYGYLSEYVAENNCKKSYMEYQQIKCIQKYYNLGIEDIAKNEKSKIANTVMMCLKDFNVDKICKESVKSDILSKRIKGIINKFAIKSCDISAYGYLLTTFAYYLRCQIVHGNKPVVLFTHADEKMLKSLVVVNELLEEFINENLPLWLDETYIQEIFIPKINTIKV